MKERRKRRRKGKRKKKGNVDGGEKRLKKEGKER